MPAPATELLLDAEHYARLMRELVPAARRFLWIATADLKDLFVEGGPKSRPFRPFVALLAELVARGVAVRLLHAKEPGPRFRADFDKHPALRDSDLFERGLCPRLHAKIIVIDGAAAYVGSANLTGAGLGAKGAHRRNFEAGVVVHDRPSITRLMDQIDALWLGRFCAPCQRRDVCPDPLDRREA
jgi:phosphatidylserine/phosphatidylglycerophosphate/cardiolipin synthase-like enzyme